MHVLLPTIGSVGDLFPMLGIGEALRARGTTVVGASAKRSALARADCVVVLEEGRVAATGRWADLAEDWGHLAG